MRGFSQSTANRCIRRVSRALASQLHNYVHFPRTEDEQVRNIRMYYEVANLPNVAACINGSLIKIGSPGGAIAELFRGRKGFFALNMLVSLHILTFQKYHIMHLKTEMN